MRRKRTKRQPGRAWLIFRLRGVHAFLRSDEVAAIDPRMGPILCAGVNELLEKLGAEKEKTDGH